jgi:hypothetical protein
MSRTEIAIDSRRGRKALFLGSCAGMADLIALPVSVSRYAADRAASRGLGAIREDRRGQGGRSLDGLRVVSEPAHRRLRSGGTHSGGIADAKDHVVRDGGPCRDDDRACDDGKLPGAGRCTPRIPGHQCQRGAHRHGSGRAPSRSRCRRPGDSLARAARSAWRCRAAARALNGGHDGDGLHALRQRRGAVSLGHRVHAYVRVRLAGDPGLQWRILGRHPRHDDGRRRAWRSGWWNVGQVLWLRRHPAGRRRARGIRRALLLAPAVRRRASFPQGDLE